MKLFAELHLDEDVSALVAVLLRARGFSVTTVREENMLGQVDSVQIAHAAASDRCLVTHNRVDFENIHRAYLESGRLHCGIIVATRRSPQEIARRVSVILNSIAADELRNQLLYV